MAEKTVIGGITNTTIHEEVDGTFHVEEWQDVEPIMNYTHAARNHRFNASAVDGMLRHEAEIPFVIFQKECEKRGIVPSLGSPQADLVIEAIMADPQYANFRAAPKMTPGLIIKGLR